MAKVKKVLTDVQEGVESGVESGVEAVVKVATSPARRLTQALKDVRAAFHRYRSTAHLDKNRYKLKR